MLILPGKLAVVKKKIVDPFEKTREPGSRGVLFHWVRDLEDGEAPLIEMERYREILAHLPDKIVTNLEKGRLAHDGKFPMLKAGLGYEELLFPVLVDFGAVGTSAAEAKVAPTARINGNYMAPGGLPGRTLRMKLRGRVTTLTTAATMTLRNRIATTDIITGTILHATGAMTMDAVAQTNTQWKWVGDIITRSVMQAGTVFAQGDADMSPLAITIANSQAKWSGSAGAATPATAAWDTTLDQFFQITAQWSLATAYSIQTHNYLLEALN